MSVVVTGATGHLGRLVVTNLLAAGVSADQIVAGGRRTERLADLAEQGVRVVTIDLAQPESLAAAFAGAETVLLVSGNEFGQRVAQHTNAIEAAKAAGVRRVVYTSAPHADSTTLAVAAEHKATEDVLIGSGLAYTLLRNGWYTENYVGDLQQARESGQLVAAVGEGRVASASRDDFAAAAAVVLSTEGHDGAVYELTGDVAWSFEDLAAAATEVLGRPVTYVPVSAADRTAGLIAAGLDEGTAGFVVAIEENTRDGLLGEVNGELSRLIGRPTTPLVDGLRAALAEG
ncbi:MAG TPA: SDR family oxidoreductase [Cellulomonas sp.]